MIDIGECAKQHWPIWIATTLGITAITFVAIVVKYFLMKKTFLANAVKTISPKVARNVAPNARNVTTIRNVAPIARNVSPFDQDVAPISRNVAQNDQSVAPIAQDVARDATPIARNFSPVDQNVTPIAPTKPINPITPNAPINPITPNAPINPITLNTPVDPIYPAVPTNKTPRYFERPAKPTKILVSSSVPTPITPNPWRPTGKSVLTDRSVPNGRRY